MKKENRSMSNNTNTLVGTLDKKVIDILSLSMEEG